MERDSGGGGGDVVAYQDAAMRLGAVAEDEQRPAKVRQQRLEEVDHLLFGDGAFMQAKAHCSEVQASDERELMPVEMKLHHRGLAFQPPSTHPGGALGDPGLIDEDNQSSLANGVFFSAGQVRLRQCSIAAGSRSRARSIWSAGHRARTASPRSP